MDSGIGLTFFRSYLLNEDNMKQAKEQEEVEPAIQSRKRFRILKEDKRVNKKTGSKQ